MHNDNLQLASASSDRSRLRNIIQADSSINRDREAPFGSSGFNTFAEAKAFASGDQRFYQRTFNAASGELETKDFSAAFQSNEDHLRHEDQHTASKQEGEHS
jgi:hypothetical protein